jgi:uncharacterized Zn ribbon protein
MWSEHAPIQVLSYRILKKVDNAWSQDLLSQMYLADDVLAWAQEGEDAGDAIRVTAVTVDSNGVELKNGDTVHINKDLDVKGANFVAKRGTAVRKIRLTIRRTWRASEWHHDYAQDGVPKESERIDTNRNTGSTIMHKPVQN